MEAQSHETFHLYYNIEIKEWRKRSRQQLANSVTTNLVIALKRERKIFYNSNSRSF